MIKSSFVTNSKMGISKIQSRNACYIPMKHKTTCPYCNSVQQYLMAAAAPQAPVLPSLNSQLDPQTVGVLTVETPQALSSVWA